MLVTGCRWQDLPREYGAPTTVWRRLKRWGEEGVWERLWRAALVALDQQGQLDWSIAFLDGSFAPAKKGGDKVGLTKKGKGTKWMLVVDGDVLEGAKLLPPILTIGGDVEEQLADRRARIQRLHELGAPAILMQNEERMLAELEARPRPAAQLRELEDQIGMLPLSVRAWYEVGGGVNLVGVHPGWVQLIAEAGLVDESFWERGFWHDGFAFDPEAGGHPMQHLEPLLINALGGHGPFGKDVLFSHPVADGRYSLALMPNLQNAYLERAEDSFDYTIEVPCTRADTSLLYERHETTFVNYLRICLRWAGFPGWERMPVRPERDIAALTAGLLPF